MIMRQTAFYFILYTTIIVTGIYGCSDEPNSVGSKLLDSQGQFSIIDTTLAGISDTVFTRRIPNGFGDAIIFGNYQGVQAVGIMKFAVYEIPDSFSTVKVDTATLYLTVNYAWEPISQPIKVTVKKVLKAWTETGVTSDSLHSSDLAPTGKETTIDTMAVGRTLTLSIDTTYISEWIRTKFDSTSPSFNGIALEANNGIWGYTAFRAASSRTPILVIKFSKNGVRDSLKITTGDDTFFADGPISTPSPFIETQGGINIRSKVSFDLKSVPVHATINRAVMELTMKTAASKIGIGTPDTVFAILGTDAADPNGCNLGVYANGYRKDKSDTVNVIYTFSTPYLLNIVQHWVNGDYHKHIL
jgi:hypothetical protein